MVDVFVVFCNFCCFIFNFLFYIFKVGEFLVGNMVEFCLFILESLVGILVVSGKGVFGFIFVGDVD